MRTVTAEIRKAQLMSDEELYGMAKEISAPFDLLKETATLGRLPVVNFAAGGVATPADAALMMQLGCDGVFVGSGIFKSSDPAKRAKAIVQVSLIAQAIFFARLLIFSPRPSLTTTTLRFWLKSARASVRQWWV